MALSQIFKVTLPNGRTVLAPEDEILGSLGIQRMPRHSCIICNSAGVDVFRDDLRLLVLMLIASCVKASFLVSSAALFLDSLLVMKGFYDRFYESMRNHESEPVRSFRRPKDGT